MELDLFSHLKTMVNKKNALCINYCRNVHYLQGGSEKPKHISDICRIIMNNCYGIGNNV